MIVLAYELGLVGHRLINCAMFFEVKIKKVIGGDFIDPIRISYYIPFNENPYKDVYFIVTESIYLCPFISPKTDKFYTNMTPLFARRYHDRYIYIYSTRILYEKGYIKIGAELLLDELREEYRSKHGNVPPNFIIIESGKYGYIMLCSQVPKEEALKIIKDYESVVLWELSGL